MSKFASTVFRLLVRAYTAPSPVTSPTTSNSATAVTIGQQHSPSSIVAATANSICNAAKLVVALSCSLLQCLG